MKNTLENSKTTKLGKAAKKGKIEPTTYLTINKTLYKAINPEKALEIAKQLRKELGTYKVHVIYGTERISKRKSVTVENEGKYTTAQETKQAIMAFLDKSLWLK
jgi:hypothetical protein